MLSPDDQRRLAAIEEQLLIDDPAFPGGWPEPRTLSSRTV